ncbi:MAG: hypothetical protein ACRCVX_08465 [Shewanella sp.]
MKTEQAKTYEANYVESQNGIGVTLTLGAENDKQAIAEVRQIVASGYRNETTCAVDLSDGTFYTCVNKHGKARGRIYPANH